MFDTINFKLGIGSTPKTDLVSEIPCYLTNISEHYYGECLYIVGSLGNLKVSVSRYQIKVKDGSLCKWYLGDNLKTLSRQDTQRAIEKLSDELHLPIDKAEITRLDIAKNFVVKYPVDVYFNHLGMLTNSKRLQQPNGLYYNLKDGQVVFYDKAKELKHSGEKIHSLYDGVNLLRYEQRYLHKLPQNLGVPIVTGAMLYDEAFYIKLADRWLLQYKEINKINDVSLNFDQMKTKQQLYKMGVLSLIEQRGGEMAMYQEIAEALKKGQLSKKQAYDLRCAVSDACKIKDGLTIPNDAMEELNKKIENSIKFYR